MKSGRKLPTVPRKVSEQRRIQAPGPGAYQPYKDGIEIESPRKNTEKHSFSKADREQYYKTFIDEKINEKVPNSITKNCAFYINPEYEGIGTQQISNSGAKNSPRIVFGKYGSEIVKVSPIKDQNPVVSKNTPFQYPQSTLSRVPDSNIKNSAKLSFGKEQRFAYDNRYIPGIKTDGLPKTLTKDVPFIKKDGFGNQIESSHVTAPGHSFSVATRDSAYLMRF